MTRRERILSVINQDWDQRRALLLERKLKMNQQSLDWHKREKEGTNLIRRVIYPSQDPLRGTRPLK